MVSTLASRIRDREFEFRDYTFSYKSNYYFFLFPCLSFLFFSILKFNNMQIINWRIEVAGHCTIMPFNFRHFKILKLEKLALFNLAYSCHPPIKPKFPSRQNYPIYGIYIESKTILDLQWQRSQTFFFKMASLIPRIKAKQDTLRGYQAFYSRYNAFIEITMTLQLMTNTI